MNKHLLKLAGLATLFLLLQTSGFAQSRTDKAAKDARGGKAAKDTAVNQLRGYDEIIIKRKSDKDAKVTIEIKNGEVLIDGKPASDYSDDDLSVRKKKIRIMDGRTFSFSGPDGELSFAEPGEPEEPGELGAPGAPRIYRAPSPFRSPGGGWSYDGKPLKKTNRALLGVISERSKEGGEGAKIKEVSKGSAAEKAGLKTGDLISKVDEITIDGPEALSDAIGKYKPEDKVTLTFKRDGKEQKATATLGKLSKENAFEYNMPDLQGFDFKDMMPMMPPPDFHRYGFKGQPRLGIRAQDTEDGKGVKVLDVDEESTAAKAGIKEGDIITRFDGKEVNSAQALAESAQAARSKPSVHVNLLREGKALDLEVKTPKKLQTADL